MKNKPKIAIIMGSDSDLKIMNQAVDLLNEFKISSHLEIISAHRTPEKMVEFSQSAADKGFQVIIAGAGGAAHLPGMVASLTTLPVIGVPVNVTALKGLDALLSIAQMPKGVPVATMAVDNAYNAGLFAVEILALQDLKLHNKLIQYKNQLKIKIQNMNKNIKRKK